ncbi:hypothetical protein AYO21_08492 [Fonsecaea monophora]|uniref:Cation/H+ exchanger transmembrane domain-containing protein n=1 Tax=Fonsecaea monophora TaxID=254056 RepID=A0A177EZ18_9EURO|nr:hypothetical protein AYO21_08492 [Fonsecaea monophora]OAG37307.1 hypothetical protein AYO21_08492 [Fonsecaea monophora]
MADAALPYHEPGIITILVQSSFFLALNVLGTALDHVFYCGLVGQVLVGMAWGTPGSKMLSREFEDAATQLGYLGLIAIVFEGGLATSAKSLGSSLLLSICVALTGICLPMALSFSLTGISHATNLQAFAAGAALCSTSLGTTFSLLKTTRLTTSRLGTILTSAAMLDDVVGLIMVQVIANLGSGRSSISATTVIRPVFVSLGFAIVIPITCKFLVKPALPHVFGLFVKVREKLALTALDQEMKIFFLLSTAFLAALVTAASYAGTSNLFAAYLAGATISWLDEASLQTTETRSQRKHSERTKLQNHAVNLSSNITSERSEASQSASEVPDSKEEISQDHQPPLSPLLRLSGEPTPPPENPRSVTTVNQDSGAADIPDALDVESRGLRMYNHYYAPAVERVLKPFFFASIGFSIPITKMFRGPVIWRGLVYALFMAIGKLFCGMWLVRFFNSSPPPPPTSHSSITNKTRKDKQQGKKQVILTRRSLPRPKSLYPASILGCAMVARGEIGFLISALAATNGIFTSRQTTGSGDGNDNDNAAAVDGDDGLVSDLYLIVTWAILLCTIAGPLALGFLAKRVKRLQVERARHGGGHGTKEDPLGIWGVN